MDITDREVRNTVIRDCVSETAVPVAAASSAAVLSIMRTGVSARVYSIACKAIMDGLAKPPGLLYEVEQSARKTVLEAAMRVGYPRAVKAAIRAAKQTAQSVANSSATKWVMTTLVDRAIHKGRGAAQKVTSKQTVQLVIRDLKTTAIRASTAALHKLTLLGEGARAYFTLAKKAALKASMIYTMPVAMLATFQGRRDGLKDAIAKKGMCAMERALKTNQSVEKAIWKVVTQIAVPAAMRGSELGAQGIIKAEGYRVALSAALDAIVQEVAADATKVRLASVINAMSANASGYPSLRTVCVRQLHKAANVVASRLVQNLEIKGQRRQILKSAENAARGVLDRDSGLIEDVMSSVRSSVLHDSQQVAQMYVGAALMDKVKLQTSGKININRIAKELLVGDYVTDSNIFLGKMSVPFAPAVSEAVQTLIKNEEKKAMHAAALHAILEAVAQDATKKSLKENMAQASRTYSAEIALDSTIKVTRALLKCGSFDASEIRKLSGSTRQKATQKLMGFTKFKYADLTEIENGVGKPILDAASNAAKHASAAVQKDADAAAKLAANNTFQRLAHEIAKTVTDSFSLNTVARLAANLTSQKLTKEVSSASIKNVTSTLHTRCSKMVYIAAENATEMAADHLGVTHPQVVEDALEIVMRDSWNLVNGSNLLEQVNKTMSAFMAKPGTKLANKMVNSVAARACRQGKSMRDAVLSKGKQELDIALSDFAQDETRKQIARVKLKLFNAALATLRTVQDKMIKDQEAGLVGNKSSTSNDTFATAGVNDTISIADIANETLDSTVFSTLASFIDEGNTGVETTDDDLQALDAEYDHNGDHDNANNAEYNNYDNNEIGSIEDQINYQGVGNHGVSTKDLTESQLQHDVTSLQMGEAL